VGIEGLDRLMSSDKIADIENFIRSRQRKNKTATDIVADLQKYGYDYHAARALVMKHWETPKEEA
jgi:hypothetical protein